MKLNKRKFNIQLGCLMLNQQQVINKKLNNNIMNFSTFIFLMNLLIFLNVTHFYFKVK